MEYLTLQDIPHRHYSTLDSRAMASDKHHHHHGSALPGIAAVCDSHLLLPSSSPLSNTRPPSFLLPPFDPFSHIPPPLPDSMFTRSIDFSFPRHGPRDPTASLHASNTLLNRSSRHTMTLPPLRLDSLIDPAVDSSKQRSEENIKIDSELQNNHARNSPPFQPGEQRSAATLPSFSQFLSATQREPSPPRTPSRRDASMESSPTNKAPHFDDVSWDSAAVGKRRRVDVTHGSEHGIYDTRRPSVIDPTLSSTFSSPRGSIAPIVPPPMPNHHHRPSLPYPPPPSSAVHARHQSSPAPHGHVTYHHQPPPSMMTPTVYAPGQSHGTPSPYSHRPSYYHDTRQTSHSMSYDAPPHDFYQQSAYAPHPAYPLQDPYSHQSSPYSNLQFQPHHGVDQSFNRKRRGNLPKEATGLLKGWFNDHRESPYPSEEEKMALCTATGLTLNQVSNWFINARRRAPGKEARDRENNNDDA